MKSPTLRSFSGCFILALSFAIYFSSCKTEPVKTSSDTTWHLVEDASDHTTEETAVAPTANTRTTEQSRDRSTDETADITDVTAVLKSSSPAHSNAFLSQKESEIDNSSEFEKLKQYPNTQPLESYFKNVAKPAISYKVNPKKNTLINCKEGTNIWVRANTFVNKETGEPITEEVEVEVTEYYQMADFVKGNLTTTSSGRLLGSGGMLNIRAMAGEVECEIAKGETVRVDFATPKDDRPMKLFNAEVTNGDINWSLSPLNFQVSSWARVKVYTGTDPMEAYERFSFIGGLDSVKKLLKEKIEMPTGDFEDKTALVKFQVGASGEIYNLKVTYIDEIRGNALKQAFSEIERVNPPSCGEYEIRNSVTLPVVFENNEISKIREPFVFKSPGAALQRQISEHNKKRSEVERANQWTSTSGTAGRRNAINPNATPNVFSFAIQSLGFINCDYFIGPQNQEKMLANVAIDDNVDVKLIFHDLNAQMAPRYLTEDGLVHFGKVPASEPITLLVIERENSDDKMYKVGYRHLLSGNDTIAQPEMVTVTESELSDELDHIIKNRATSFID